jgi:hypothetical protein
MHLDVYGPDEPSFTSEDGVEHLSRADAVAEVERCAFTTGDGRSVTHSFAGRMGADWDTSGAVEAIGKSADRAWLDSDAWGPCLHVIIDGKLVVFDQVVPA